MGGECPHQKYIGGKCPTTTKNSCEGKCPGEEIVHLRKLVYNYIYIPIY